MHHQLPASSTDPNGQDEAAELRRGMVFFWWLVMLLFPIVREANGGTPPVPFLPLPLHAAFILGSTALLLLVRAQASAGPLPLTTIASLLIGLGLGQLVRPAAPAEASPVVVRPLAVGIVHGLAGSAGVALFVVPKASTSASNWRGADVQRSMPLESFWFGRAWALL